MGKHLTFEQRAKLAALHDAALTQAAIAAQIGSNQSVVSRELRRNQGGRGYRCRQAHEKAAVRRTAASLIPHKLDDAMFALIEGKLWREEWSPQQISCWLARTQQTCISHERIYQLIWADKHAGGTLFRQLRRRGKAYNKRAGKLAGRGISLAASTSINDRPL